MESKNAHVSINPETGDFSITGNIFKTFGKTDNGDGKNTKIAQCTGSLDDFAGLRFALNVTMTPDLQKDLGLSDCNQVTKDAGKIAALKAAAAAAQARAPAPAPAPAPATGTINGAPVNPATGATAPAPAPATKGAKARKGAKAPAPAQ